MVMALAIRWSVVTLCLLAGAAVQAQELIPWAPSLEQAQKAATEQRKLLLLHFYNDNCAPCERLEKNVFSQAKVAAAIDKNYIPVKVHAGQKPQVAAHYRVERWPTDVICTPAGLEIYRTVSLQSADQFVALCDNVALQAGVGASRQWTTAMQAAGQQVFDQTAAQAQATANQVAGTAQSAASQFADQSATAGQQYLAQANATVQGYAQQTDQQVNQTAQQFNQQVNQTAQQATQTADQARATTRDWTRRLNDTTGQLTATGQQFGQAAQNAARDLRTTWDPASLQTQSPYGGPAVGTTPPPAAAGTSIYQPYGQAAAAPSLPTNNPWTNPAAGAPPAQTATTVQPYLAAQQPGPQQPPAADPAAVAAAIATLQGKAPAMQPAASGASAAPTITQAPTSQPATSQPPTSQTVPGPSAPSQTGDRQFVAASQAPPIAMEGYCPVTLLEDRKWHKSDPKFGAIHRGRTYLFRTAAEQTKFLTDPDRYSPVLSGLDPVVFAQRGEQVEGKRSYGLTYNRQIYLFADEASLKAFEQSPQAYATAAHTAMLQAETAQTYR
jgi:thioredoxin-related protein/YHS domain-containing protein